MLHRSADEVDEIQSQQLYTLLDQWEAGEQTPENVLLGAANIVGAEHIGSFISYRVSLEYNVPGTEGFEDAVNRERGLILSRWRNIETDTERQLVDYKTQTENLKSRGFSPKPEHVEERQAAVVKRSEETGIAVPDNDAVFEGPKSYVETVQSFIDLRKEAERSGDEYEVACINVALVNLISDKEEAERDYNDIDAALERYKAGRIADHEAKAADLRAKFKPEVLQEGKPTDDVIASITMIRKKMDDLELSSWDAAVAIAEIIYIEGRKFEKMMEDGPEGVEMDVLMEAMSPFSGNHSPLEEFEGRVREEESKISVTRKKDPVKTRNLLDPETEDDFKTKYLSHFLDERPFQEWRAETMAAFKEQFRLEKYPDSLPEDEADAGDLVSLLESFGKNFDHLAEGKPPVREERAEDEGWTKDTWRRELERRTSYREYTNELYRLDREERDADRELRRTDYDAWREKNQSEDAAVEAEHEEAEPEFQSPLVIPDDLVISEMHIVPSGTGLIQLYNGDESHSWVKTDTARITTYAVSLVPENEEDIEVVKDLAQQALHAIGRIPYDYMHAENDKSEAYKRVGEDDSYFGRASDYIAIEDGEVKIRTNVDLDDLYILYYMLEPALEPNEQIAAAMNAARYAEERGAILSPDPYQDEFDQGYVNDDQPGTLKKGEEDDTLADAMRGTISDLAMGIIDEAAFVARISVISDHTLTGSMRDVAGVLPTFEELKLLESDKSQSSEPDETGREIISYEQAMRERIDTLLRAALGLEPDSEDTLKLALMRTTHQIGPALKEDARERADQHGRDLAIHLEREFTARDAKIRQDIEEGRDPLKDFFKEEEFATRLSDAFVGRTGPAHPFSDDGDPDLQERREGLVHSGSLVVRDSEVETCLDGIHDLGGGRYYRTRTKDSLLPRKELPLSLKPFEPENDPRAGVQVLALENIQ